MPFLFHFTPPPQQEITTFADFIACEVLSSENQTLAVGYCQRAFETTGNIYSLEDLIRDAFAAKRLELLKKILEKIEKNKNLEVYRYEIEALLALAEGNQEEFYRYAKKALEKGTKNPAILLQLYRQAVEKRDINTLVLVLKRLHELLPYDEKITNLLLKLLPPSEKIKLLKELVKENPSPSFYARLVELLIEKGDFKSAVSYLKMALQKYPNNKTLRELYIKTEVKLGNIHKAEEQARKWNMVSASYLALADYYADNGNFKGLKNLINKTLQEFPDKPQLLGKLLLYSLAFQFPERYIEKLGNAYLKYIEDHSCAISSKQNPQGKSLKTCGEDKIAETYLLWSLLNGVKIPEIYIKDLVLQNGNSSPRLLLLRSMLLIKEKGELREAAELIEKIKPDELSPYWKRVYDALKLYIDILTRHTLSAKLFNNPNEVITAANILYNFDRNFSRKVLLQYVNLSPSLNRYRKAFQIAYSHGDLSFIVELFRTAAKRYPTDPWVLNTYAYTLLMTEGKKASSQACKLLKTAVQYAPSDPSIWDSLGWCLYLKGDIREAVLYLKKAMKLAKGPVPVIYYHYAKVLAREGKPCEALKYAMKSLEELENMSNEPEKGITKRVKALIEQLKVCTDREKHSWLHYSNSIL